MSLLKMSSHPFEVEVRLKLKIAYYNWLSFWLFFEIATLSPEVSLYNDV